MERKLKNKLPGGRFDRVEPLHRKMMQAVKGKGNRTTESRFRGALVGAGFTGWKTNFSDVLGKPDFYFLEPPIAVFIDGCFWHGCPACGHVPSKNKKFWKAKILRNKERDGEITWSLRKSGIRVLRFWEHEVARDISCCLKELRSAIVFDDFPQARKRKKFDGR